MEAISTGVIRDFAIILTIAGIVVFLFYKLKQPLILGYLIAGIIIGPYTPPSSLISRPDVFGAAADLGVILLLFGIGLEFPLTTLRKVGLKGSLGVASIEIAIMFLLSYGITHALGWTFMDSLFLGAALASSSTVIITKVLSDMGKLKDPSAPVMMGILIAEDLVVVVILAIITTATGISSATLSVVGWTLGKVFLFIFGTLIVGRLLVPRIIDRVAQLKREEVLVLVALGICFGMSVVANLLGLSMAIGAFLTGVLVADAKSIRKVETLTSPVRHVFAAMFFVSMGALIDVSQFRVFIVPALIVTGLMMTGKVFGCAFGTRIFGYSKDTSWKVGLGMCQIGEFAFIVVKAGQDLNLVSSFLFPIIGVAAAITAFLTPYMVKLSYGISKSEA